MHFLTSIICVVLCLFTHFVRAQRSYIKHEKPEQVENVIIYYKPSEMILNHQDSVLMEKEYWDEKASLNQMVYKKDIPVRGATYRNFYGANLRQKFSNEIKQYPDNYFAYARYIDEWPSDTVNIMLPKIITKLLKVKNSNDGLLSALIVAYSKQVKRDLAYPILLQLLKKYPSSQVSGFALSLHLYEQYKAGGPFLATGELNYRKLVGRKI